MGYLGALLHDDGQMRGALAKGHGSPLGARAPTHAPVEQGAVVGEGLANEEPVDIDVLVLGCVRNGGLENFKEEGG